MYVKLVSLTILVAGFYHYSCGILVVAPIFCFLIIFWLILYNMLSSEYILVLNGKSLETYKKIIYDYKNYMFRLSLIVCSLWVIYFSVYLFQNWWISSGKSLEEFQIYIFIIYMSLILQYLISTRNLFFAEEIEIGLKQFKTQNKLSKLINDRIGFIIFIFANIRYYNFIVYIIISSLGRGFSFELFMLSLLCLSSLSLFTLLPKVRLHILSNYGALSLKQLQCNTAEKNLKEVAAMAIAAGTVIVVTAL